MPANLARHMKCLLNPSHGIYFTYPSDKEYFKKCLGTGDPLKKLDGDWTNPSCLFYSKQASQIFLPPGSTMHHSV